MPSRKSISAKSSRYARDLYIVVLMNPGDRPDVFGVFSTLEDAKAEVEHWLQESSYNFDEILIFGSGGPEDFAKLLYRGVEPEIAPVVSWEQI